jgi:Glucose-6-phosphate 1-dehydrogenase
MTAMECPISFDADAVRAKKAEVLQAVRPLDPASVVRDAVRGQYAAGTVLGKPVNGYRQEPDVAADSNIETYVAAKLVIDNWRWAACPSISGPGNIWASARPRSPSAFARRRLRSSAAPPSRT